MRSPPGNISAVPSDGCLYSPAPASFPFVIDRTYSLTARFAEEIGAQFIIRGLRTTQDFTYEQQIAFVNEEMAPDVQHVFILSNQINSSVSSTIVRDLIRHGGAYKKYVPNLIGQLIEEHS